MKNLVLISQLCIYGILLGLFACNKDKPEPATPTPCISCQSVTEAKDFFAFKVGTYWIYQEENSLELDTLTVTESQIDATGYNFDVRIYSTREDCYYHYWPTYLDNKEGCSQSEPVSKKCLFVNKSKYQLSNYVYQYKCIFLQYKKGDVDYEAGLPNVCENSTITVVDILNNFSNGIETFGKTVKIGESCSLSENNQAVEYHYSHGIGITRKYLQSDNKTWNLINYKIQK